LFNPIAYFVEVMRMVLLKGSTFVEIQKHFIILIVSAIGINALAVFNYKKTN
jgi:ABC-2 type transport system permease protein